jgi:hypothetical protein
VTSSPLPHNVRPEQAKEAVQQRMWTRVLERCVVLRACRPNAEAEAVF